MDIFKRRRHIHLSPQLARTIGRESRSGRYYLLQIAFVTVLAITLVLVSKSKENDLTVITSRAMGDEDNGQVLGETTELVNYQVKDGDSLIKISQRFGVYWLTIVEENELKPPYLLRPGDILRI